MAQRKHPLSSKTLPKPSTDVDGIRLVRRVLLAEGIMLKGLEERIKGGSGRETKHRSQRERRMEAGRKGERTQTNNRGGISSRVQQ